VATRCNEWICGCSLAGNACSKPAGSTGHCVGLITCPEESKEVCVCANNCPKRCNNIQLIYVCKLLYVFRVLSPPIIRSSYHCRVSTVSGINETVTVTCRERDWIETSFNPVTFTTGGSNGPINARYYRYSDMSS